MYSYVCTASFVAYQYEKTKIKPKKIENELSLTINQIVALSNAINAMKEAFDTLNAHMGSSNWTNQAKAIAQITENISTRLSECGTGIVQAINETVATINATDGKTSAAIDTIQSNVQVKLDKLSAIKPVSGK